MYKLSMAYIEWTDSLSVGVELFNRQHRKLLDMVNEMYDALTSGKTNDVMEEILERLIDYTVEHFQSEEGYFKKYDYPLNKQHKQEHDSLVKDVLLLKEKFVNGDVTISYETMSFLQDWLQKHILESDMDYKAFFNGKGVY